MEQTETQQIEAQKTPEESKKQNFKVGLTDKLLYFSITCVLLTFVYIFSITFIPIPKDNQRYADVVLGFLLGTLVGTIITYYFGSSNSSKEKEEAYRSLVNKNFDKQ